MEINVLFFGVLAEISGTHSKHYSDIASFDDLKHRIEDDFPEIVNYDLFYTVNDGVLPLPETLSGGDEVACFPPFTGD